MLVCGIDIGTTNLKVALFDGENRLVWLRSEATPRSRDEIGTVTDATALVGLIGAMVADERPTFPSEEISGISRTTTPSQ